MMSWFKNYSIPILLAVLLHGLFFGFQLLADFNAKEPPSLFEPTIYVGLIQLEPEITPTSVIAPSPSPAEPVLDTMDDLIDSDSDDPPEPEISQEEETRKRLQTLEQLRLEDAVSEELNSLNAGVLDAESEKHVQAIYTALVRNWSRPPSARNHMEVKIQVELFPDGTLNTASVLKSSGHAPFDRSAMDAVDSVKTYDVPKNTELFEKRFRKFTIRFKGEDLLR